MLFSFKQCAVRNVAVRNSSATFRCEIPMRKSSARMSLRNSYATCNMKHATDNVKHATYDMPHSICNMRHQTF